jgi:DNA-binding XRE family transcriptional regulator/mannose-6-phosphate isomerase-like protein (cupin superfamily)
MAPLESAQRRGPTAAAPFPMAPNKTSDAPLGVPAVVAARLRARREERGTSVRALARDVGVSASLVSQIENGKANPSVGTLYAIVSALDVSLDELFADADPPAAAGTSTAPLAGPVLRAADRRSISLASGVRWDRLTANAEPDVDFLYVTYDVGGASCPPDALMRHNGREYGLVLSGRLGATVGFDAYELDPGDSIVLPSTTPHRFWTIGDEPTTVVWTVVGRTGDPRAAFEG